MSKTKWNFKALAQGVAVSLGLMMTAGTSFAADCNGDTLCKVMESGTLRVGVVGDYKPWGYRTDGGEFEGIEPDMARKFAEILGVEVEMVPVNSANRMEFLAQGQIDLMIATMTDNQDRRKVVGIVHPNYYSSGYNVIFPKAVTPPNWEALKGQKICAIQGSWYNRPAQELFDLDYLAFPGISEVEAALRQGLCVGWLFDDNLINVMMADPSGRWNDYHMPLASQSDAPWGLAVRLDDLDKPWGQLISGILYNWHRDGTLLELEQEHGVAESPFLRNSYETLKDHLQ
jgi:polar amino acid transport system substrate-binding protein